MDFTIKCRRILIAASEEAGNGGKVSAHFTDHINSDNQRVRLELLDIPSDILKDIRSGENYQLSISLIKTTTNA